MIKTLHGVHIPPKKQKPGRANALTIDFVITGVIPSKKNRQLATMNYNKFMGMLRRMPALTIPGIVEALKACKPFIRHSKKFGAWETAKMALIREQKDTWLARLQAKGYKLNYPIFDASIKIYHYWKDNLVRDNSNKSETLHDLLVKAGVLAGDHWQCLNPIYAEAGCYEGEILDHITVIQITAYNWPKTPPSA